MSVLEGPRLWRRIPALSTFCPSTLTVREAPAIVPALVFGSTGGTRAQGSPPAATRTRKETLMSRAATLGTALLLAASVVAPADALAQTKDDTVVYALQSDVQNWDPPNSVLRESIILGYHVFDHLAARDLKTGKVGPSLAVSWKTIDDTTWEVKLRKGVKFHDGTPFSAQGREGDVRARAESREQAHRARQPRQDQERRGRRRPHRALQDRRPVSALRRAPHRAGDRSRRRSSRRRATSGCRTTRSAPGPTSS